MPSLRHTPTRALLPLVATLLGVAACRTATVSTGAADPNRFARYRVRSEGPLFDEPVVAREPLPARLGAFTLLDTRKETRPRDSLRVPVRTRTGWWDRVALRLDDHHRERLTGTVEAQLSGEGRVIDVEATVLEATALWDTLEDQEREVVRIDLYLRVLDHQTGRQLAAGKSATHGARARFDVSAASLLSLVDRGLAIVVTELLQVEGSTGLRSALERGDVGREVGSPYASTATLVRAEARSLARAEPLAPEVQTSSTAPDDLLATQRAGHFVPGTVLGHTELSGGLSLGAWAGGGRSPGGSLFRLLFLSPVSRRLMAGVELGVDVYTSRASALAVGPYIGPSLGTVVQLSPTWRLIPSSTLLLGALFAAKDGWGVARSTAALAPAWVDNTGSGDGGGISSPPTVYVPGTSWGDSGPSSTGVYAWLGLRAALGVESAPTPLAAGVTFAPYVELDWVPVEGLRLSGGLMVALSSTSVGLPSPDE